MHVSVSGKCNSNNLALLLAPMIRRVSSLLIPSYIIRSNLSCWLFDAAIPKNPTSLSSASTKKIESIPGKMPSSSPTIYYMTKKRGQIPIIKSISREYMSIINIDKIRYWKHITYPPLQVCPESYWVGHLLASEVLKVQEASALVDQYTNSLDTKWKYTMWFIDRKEKEKAIHTLVVSNLTAERFLPHVTWEVPILQLRR